MILRRDAVPPGSPSTWPRHVLEGGGFEDPGSPSSPSLQTIYEHGLDEDMEVLSPCASPALRFLSCTFTSSRIEKGDRLNSEQKLFDAQRLRQDDTATSTGHPGSSRDVPMKKADCARASRAARASDPSSEGTTRAYAAMYESFQQIRKAGIERAPKGSQAFKPYKSQSTSGGKGSAVKTSTEYQQKMNHLAALKAKDIDSQNTEPAFLLGGFTTNMLWDRLAENSLKSNAVNSSVSAFDPLTCYILFTNVACCTFTGSQP